MNYLWGGMILIGIIYGTITGNLGAVTEAAVNSSREAVNVCIVMAGVTAMWVGMMRIAENAGLVEGLMRKMNPILAFLFPDIPKDHEARRHIAMNMIANFLGLGWAATPAGLKAMESLAELEEERRKAGAGKIEEDVIHKGWEKKKEPADMTQSSVVQSGVSQGSAAQSSMVQSGVSQGSTTHKKNGRRRWERGGMPSGVASNEMCTFLILNISSLQLIPVNIIAYRSQYGSVNPTAIVGPGILATAVSTAVAVVFCKVMDNRRQRA